MKHFLLLFTFTILNTFVFSQRRSVAPPEPKNTILLSVFSKSDIKRIQYNKIKIKKQYPYLEIYLRKDGTKDSLIFGYSKPLIDIEFYKRGYIPVYYNF